MNIKNTSNRIINIGTTILRPDDTMPATDQLVATPAIKALIGKGWLAVESALEDSVGSRSGGTSRQNSSGRGTSRKNSSGRGTGGRKPSKGTGGSTLDGDTEDPENPAEDPNKDGKDPSEGDEGSSAEQ